MKIIALTMLLSLACAAAPRTAPAGPEEDFEQCYQALAHQDYLHCVARCTPVAKDEELDPRKRSAAYSNRGVCYEFTGNLRRALQDHDLAVSLWPENASAYANRAFVHFKSGEYGLAETDVRRARELDPDARVPEL